MVIFVCHTHFDMFEDLMPKLYCALMLCVLSCQVAIELGSSFIVLRPNSKSISLLLTCY